MLGAEKLMLAAERHAKDAMSRLDFLLPCTSENRNASCAHQFITDFGRRAFQRSLTSVEVNALVQLFDWGVIEDDFEYGIRVVIEQVLQSPNFLYPMELTPNSNLTSKLTGLSTAGRLTHML